MPLIPSAPFDDNRTTPDPNAPPRSPCRSCSIVATLNAANLCCDCQQEKMFLVALQRNKPVYLLTESLFYHRVLTLTPIPDLHNFFTVTVPDITGHYTAELSSLHLSIPSLVTAGIAKANDAILRLNQLHKQHLALT